MTPARHRRRRASPLRWAVPGAVVVAAAVVAVVLVGGHHTPTTTSSTTSSTHPTSVPIAPLTGLPDPNGRALTRPALTVKIENVPAAMPQQGIDQADVIYEEIVEGGITRLAAIFNSKDPPIIGPIRSVRKTDRELVWPIGGIFVYSGGAQYAVNSIETAPVKLIDEDTAGDAMYRDDNGRVAPNNLYGIGSRLFNFGGTPTPPPPLFSYRAPGATVPGRRVSSFIVGFGAGYTVSYNWDGHTKSWNRFQFQAPDVTADGTRLSPANVIVQFVHYQGGVGVIRAQATLIGTGPVAVFTDGREITGTWHRGSLSDVTHYRMSDGKAIRLTPGQTWVELLNYSYPLTVTYVPTSHPTSTTSTS